MGDDRWVGEKKLKCGLRTVESVSIGNIGEKEGVIGVPIGNSTTDAFAGGCKVTVESGFLGVKDTDRAVVGQDAADRDVKGAGVFPDGELARGGKSGGSDEDGKECIRKKSLARRDGLGKEVEEGDGEPDGGEVGEAIGDEVEGDGDDAADGCEKGGGRKDAEPEERVFMTATDHPEDSQKEGDGKECAAEKARGPARVDDGEVAGQKGLGEVEEKDRGDSRHAGQEWRIIDVVCVRMGENGGEGGEGGEEEKGEQRKEDGEGTMEGIAERTRARWGRRQRPDGGEGEERKKDGERGERWLDEEAGGECEEGEENECGPGEPAAGTGQDGEPDVGDEQSKEQREDILALGDPGDGLDTKGMKGPEEGKQESGKALA